MHFFRNHYCKEPEVLKEIKNRELWLENFINKFRIFLITFLSVGDFITAHILGVFKASFVVYGILFALVIYSCLGWLHVITKQRKPRPALKYITVFVDYMWVFVAFVAGKDLMLSIIPISLDQLLLLATIFFITINSVSALKIQVPVIFFSTALGIVLNVIMHWYLGSQLVIIIYSSTFILISGFFDRYISDFIFHSFVSNHRLAETNKNLAQAHEEIKTQNEEINAQNDELATQNEYLAKQRDEITFQKKQITSSIEYASRIQKAVLDTTSEIEKVALESFIVFEPKDIVSGDFYWFKEIKIQEKLYKIFAAVDCTGHGVPGAFMSMLGTSFLNEIVTEFTTEINAARILNRLRENVKNQLHQKTTNTQVKDGMDMALCILDYENMSIQYAGANNPLFLVRPVKGKNSFELEEFKPDKMPIGVYLKEKESFTNTEIAISKGDIVYVFSDGIVDQFGGTTGEKFKKRRLKELLLKVAHLPMKEQKSEIERELRNWMGSEFDQIDDITLIGVKI